MVFGDKQRGQPGMEVEGTCSSSTRTSPVTTLLKIEACQKQLSFPPRTFLNAEDLVGKLTLDAYLTNQSWNSFIKRNFIGK